MTLIKVAFEAVYIDNSQCNNGIEWAFNTQIMWLCYSNFSFLQFIYAICSDIHIQLHSLFDLELYQLTYLSTNGTR